MTRPEVFTGRGFIGQGAGGAGSRSDVTGGEWPSLRDLYEHGVYQDMRARSPICAHGTVRKIMRLYKDGTLQPYLDYVYPSVQEPWPSFGRWVAIVPDDSWKWWRADTAKRCAACRCLKLKTSKQCQKCDAVFTSYQSAAALSVQLVQ